jgi:D-alanine transaminase
MADVYLNGIFMDAAQACISPMDRGFLFADGVYEVIPTFNGVLFRLNQHLRRLQRSLGDQIPDPHSGDAWQDGPKRPANPAETSSRMEITEGYVPRPFFDW